ncbi:hypothetical protein [Stackebrandtia soli]|uniref:hypothetical protein n=1 Tax=Stackebrandtia soli TaxID=1892856 RepID=UPI0039EC2812
MENIDSLFTAASLLSLQGAVAAAVLVPNVVGNLVGERFNPFRKWTSLGIALVLAYVAAIVATDADPTKWFVAFFNGLLIFASAMGLNQLPRRNRSEPATDTPKDETDEAAAAKPKAPSFFKSWV